MCNMSSYLNNSLAIASVNGGSLLGTLAVLALPDGSLNVGVQAAAR